MLVDAAGGKRFRTQRVFCKPLGCLFALRLRQVPHHFAETTGLNAAALQRLATGSARQAPLHGERAASIGAAGDDAEVGARLLERVQLDVGLGGTPFHEREGQGFPLPPVKCTAKGHLSRCARLC